LPKRSQVTRVVRTRRRSQLVRGDVAIGLVAHEQYRSRHLSGRTRFVRVMSSADTGITHATQLRKALQDNRCGSVLNRT
jgi:hypothetical protein